MAKRGGYISFLSCTSAIIMALSASPPAFALPKGGVVSGGSARITASGKQMDIHQKTDRAVIDWREFNIAPDEHTRFRQPSKNATVLNRVNDPNPSQILGKLSANGNVVLVNPNGIFFGRNSRIDVNGLVATTADVNNDAFMKGSAIPFDKPGNPNAEIHNAGTITAREAGLVGLVAPSVENSGVIEAKLGRVQLASGDAATVDFYGDGLMKIRVSDEVKGQLVKNTGTIESGTISLTAAAGKDIVDSLIDVQGELKAARVERQGGKIIIAAEGSNAVSGNIAADKGKKTGHSTVLINGKITAENAGSVQVAGDKIALLKDTNITADGRNKGGNIRIGGDYQGKGTAPAATDVFVETGAKISADATRSGKGGRVIVWSDKDTAFGGFITATGFSEGGFAEVSGKHWLDFVGSADLRAASGNAGMLLLDPTNITITAADSVPALNWNGTNFSDSVSNRNSANLSATTLQNQLALSDVTVTTASAGAGTGTLTVSSALTWSSPYSLTLFANDYMRVAANITYAGNSDVGLTLQANNYIRLESGADITVNTGGGATGSLDVTLNSDRDGNSDGSIRLDTNSDIRTNGGDIVMGGGANPLTGYAWGNSAQNDGIDLKSTNIVDAGGGNITMHGHGLNGHNTSTVVGIMVDTNSQIKTSGNGNIVMYGIGGNGVGNPSNHLYGINVVGTSVIEVENGSIEMDGTGGNSTGATGSYVSGIRIEDSIVRSIATAATPGTISLMGRAGSAPTTSQEGIKLFGPTAKISSGYADIILDGTGGNGGSCCARGVLIASNSTVESTGTGANAANIDITGRGGNGAGLYHEGILVQNQNAGGNTGIKSVDGDITLIGTSGVNSASASGISLNTSSGSAGALAYIWSTGDGDIILDGTAAPGMEGIETGGNTSVQIGSNLGTGTIYFITDMIGLYNTYTVNSGGDVVFRPRTAGVSARFGSATTTGDLYLTDTMLNNVTAGGALWLGGHSSWNNSGNVEVNYASIRNIDLNLMSGADLNVTGKTLSKNGGAASVDWNLIADGNITVSGSADITSSSGAINLTMHADYDESGAGNITLGAGSNYTLNSGDIVLRAQGLFLDATSSINTTGDATIASSAPGTSVGVGTGAGSLSISDTELARFTGNMASLTIGDADAGAMEINSAYTFSDAVTFLSGGDITISRQITASDSGTALQIAAGDDLLNTHGAGVFNLTGGGRFLTWSDAPGEDTGEEHFANSNTPHYGRDYGDAVTEPGSVRNYSSTPTLTVTPDSLDTTYGDANPAFTYVISGWAAGDQAQDNITGSATFGSDYVLGDNAGTTYTISRTADNLASALGYAFNFVTNTGDVLKATLTVTADDITIVTGGMPVFTASYSGFKNGDDATDLTTAPSFTDNAPDYNTAGIYVITPAGAASTNYDFAYVNGDLTINAAGGGGGGGGGGSGGGSGGGNTPPGGGGGNPGGGSGGPGNGNSNNGGSGSITAEALPGIIENSRTAAVHNPAKQALPSDRITQLFDADNGQYVGGLPVSAIDDAVLHYYNLIVAETSVDAQGEE